MSKLLTLALLAAAGFGFAQLDPVAYVRHGSMITQAHAIVGMPATPVSVAGVARRSVRRGW
jgi:hypothetical protein